MDNLSSILKKKVANKTNKNIHSEVHYWTDVISSAFGERKRFAMYLGTIKRIGVTQAQKIFNEIKDSKVDSPGKLFFWKCKQLGVDKKTKKG
ncbi:MAG: hypothetical protein US42_C0002G0082 [Candidatus Magasanikbacteria bacterium GW2011_GWC2_37_14]|uniref:Uncharacterized protein n=1 Tax=Candidatus Magasanikbacteria bacterium GW2011_GWC2_37_14 TaxID=1619046 RepID=A0A0G0GDS9_9BACT|nr:MAG: hypothetical protein US42_C0002G0082 [Candidatus Magasanikbacteria bacterium GW2011_GWC2_37_14]